LLALAAGPHPESKAIDANSATLFFMIAPGLISRFGSPPA
jgi:hypothetical protein